MICFVMLSHENLLNINIYEKYFITNADKILLGFLQLQIFSSRADGN